MRLEIEDSHCGGRPCPRGRLTRHGPGCRPETAPAPGGPVSSLSPQDLQGATPTCAQFQAHRAQSQFWS